MKGHGQHEGPRSCLCPSLCTGVLFSAGADISYFMYAEHTCTKLDRCSESQAAAKGHAYDSPPASSEAAAHVVPSLS